MSDDKKMSNRWLVVFGAILIQLCLGAIYAWSVFTPALKAKSPGNVASVYGPSQLGIDADKDKAMRAELTSPNKMLKEVGAKIKGETDKDKLKVLKVTQVGLTKAVDGIVVKYVEKNKLDSLMLKATNAQTTWIFGVGLAFFAIVMVLAGRMMPKLGPQKLAIAGGLVLGLGYVLAGVLGAGSFWTLLICIGVIGGSGIGLAYVVPIAVGVKWFPDKKGLIAGLAVAGFGFGALIWVKLAGQWGSLIATMGLPTTFIIYGVAFAACCIIGSIWMKNPPEGYTPAGWSPPAPKAGAAIGSIDVTSSKMLAMPQFYMIFLCFAFGAGAGLMTIGLMKAFPMKAMMAGGMGWEAASAAAGTAIAVFFSLANGIGRIVWGALSDKLGRKLSIIIMMATQGVLVIAFQWMAGDPMWLYVGAALIGFNFGGNFALFPMVTADTFGTKNLAQNYGWVFLAYGVGGICGPMLGGVLGDMGNFPMAFTICGIAVLAAAGIIAMVKPPKAAA